MFYVPEVFVLLLKQGDWCFIREFSSVKAGLEYGDQRLGDQSVVAMEAAEEKKLKGNSGVNQQDLRDPVRFQTGGFGFGYLNRCECHSLRSGIQKQSVSKKR